MELDELAEILSNKKRLEELENKPATPFDPSDGMETLEEAKSYIRFLFTQLQESKDATKHLQQTMDELLSSSKRQDARLDEMSAREQRHLDQIAALTSALKDANDLIKKLTKQLETKSDRLDVVNGEHYGSSKSLKGTESNTKTKGKNDGRDNFDGTPNSLSQDSKSMSDDQAEEVGDLETNKDLYHGPSRKGWVYKKQVVGEPKFHVCDRSKLPEGTVILKTLKPKVVRDVICTIQEHHFERLKVRYPDGKVKVVYLPEDNDEESYIYNEIVPGTGVTANLLSFLLFNRYQMATPAYRETKNRLADMAWNTCRQNLLNWADKGAIQLNKLIPSLKSIALQKGANVNVDETWCRYQTHFGNRKTYMWCLVNRKAGIVIFFYEDTVDEYGKKKEGGRGRSVLKDFLGDAKIKSLQSDGYNVYMYLDGDLMDIEHLCCLAHARAKLKVALNQGCHAALYFINCISKLYRREDLYNETPNMTPQKIYDMRNDDYTNKIIEGMKERMMKLIGEGESRMSDLMWRALNYLRNFWDKIFAYRNDGEYTIDNLAAERAIRPMTVQRKNSLFYCSTKGAKNAALYNTFIETCKQAGISFREYFRQVILDFKDGRTDYENLLPMTISLNR